MAKYITRTLMFLNLCLLLSCNEPQPQIQKNESFTAYLDTIIQDWEGQDKFIDEYKRLTNLDMHIVQPPHQQYMDKLLVSFSEIDSPDVCEILPEYLPYFITQGYALLLNDFVDNSEYINDFPNDFLDNYRAPNGDLYGFPARDGGGCVTYIRKDWLDNLNLGIPKTWDEFYNVLYQFTYGDPDGNGLDDTKGYTDINSASQDWYNRAIMLDARVEIYFDNDKWVDGFTKRNMIQALVRLKKIYKNGLTDSNITNNTTFTARTRFINGDVGVITYWANHWARNLIDRTAAASSINAEIISIPPLEGSYYIKRVAPLIVVTTKAENPELVFSNFIDKQFDKGEIQQLFTYGVKGYHWSYNGGEPEFLINKNDPYTAPFTKSFVPPVSVLNDWKQPMKIDSVIIPALNILNNYSKQDRLQNGGTYFIQYYMEIEKKLKPDIMSRILNEELTVEEGLSLYKRRSKELYLNEILDELNSL